VDTGAQPLRNLLRGPDRDLRAYDHRQACRRNRGNLVDRTPNWLEVGVVIGTDRRIDGKESEVRSAQAFRKGLCEVKAPGFDHLVEKNIKAGLMDGCVSRQEATERGLVSDTDDLMTHFSKARAQHGRLVPTADHRDVGRRSGQALDTDRTTCCSRKTRSASAR